MPEEKENAGKDNSEPSLEKQLLDLLQGLPSQAADEESVDKKAQDQGTVASGKEAAPQSPEAPPVAGKPVPPEATKETPLSADINALLGKQSQGQIAPGGGPIPSEAAKETPLSADLNALLGKQSQGQVGPGGGLVPPGPTPRVDAGGPVKSSDDAKRSRLADEIGGLFGGAPAPAQPPLAGPLKPASAGPATNRVPVMPHVPETGPTLRANEAQGHRPVPGAGTPETEAFAEKVLNGPKVGGFKLLEKRTVSLSIEGTSLRIMTMSGKSVETWTSVPLGPRLIKEGYVANSAGLAETIASALKARNISAGRLVCAFTSLGAVHRIIHLPETARKELDSIVPRELRRATINPDAYSITWQVLEGKPGSIQVFVVGVPREPLIGFIDALRLAKVKPAAIDLKPLALARAINQRDAIIAHGEADSIELAIVLDAVPSLMRSIYLGPGAAPGLVAARLGDELERTVDFYNGTHRTNPLSTDVPVYVTGEIANYPTLVEGLVSGTGRSLARLEPPLKLPKDLPLPLFMVNIGLLLKKG